MKSLAELQEIRDRMKGKVALREGVNETRIVVGMATCGIAAGARPVLSEFLKKVHEAGLDDRVTVTQTGCVGMCRLEPIVEVFEPDRAPVTYAKVRPDMVDRIVIEHIKNGKPIAEFMAGEDKV